MLLRQRVDTLCVCLENHNMSKDTNFYNKEGAVYSQKRYPVISTDYVHFFFKKRRAILMRMLRDISATYPQMTALLEVGCADGVIIRGIKSYFPKFTQLVGVDISPAMIAEAIGQSSGDIDFYVRDRDVYGAFDVVVEVGVVNLTDMEMEFIFVKKNMKHGGYYICSLASRTSSRSRLKFNHTDFANHLSFEEYEEAISSHFVIVEAESYGLFVPIIWKIPFLGRLLQLFAEVVGKICCPQLFHEKIYLLRLR